MRRLAIGLGSSLLVASSSAQPVVYVNAAAPPGGNGQSWATAFNDLQDALAAAPGAEFWIAAGTYLPDPLTFDRTVSFDLVGGTQLYGGFNGTEMQRSQRNWTLNETRLSGDLFQQDGANFFNTFDNTHHLVTVIGETEPVTVDGLIIERGNADGPEHSSGGGALISGSSVMFANCVFQLNRAEEGCAMFADAASTLDLSACTFTQSRNLSGRATGGVHLEAGSELSMSGCTSADNFLNGGGVLLIESIANLAGTEFLRDPASSDGAGVRAFGSSANISGCTFRDLDANNGPAIYSRNSVVEISDCLLEGNTSTRAGAVYSYESTTTVSRTEFIGNTGRDGGALWAEFSNLEVDECLFQGNAADADGGAILLSSPSSTVVVDRCVFDGNRAGRGGGVAIGSGPPAPVTAAAFLRCDFIGNEAGGAGGAVDVFTGQTRIEVYNSRFMSNRARLGGALTGTLAAVNCVFSGNKVTEDFGGAIRAFGGSLIANSTFASNTSRTGGAGLRYEGAGLVLFNSVFWTNRAAGAMLEGQQISFAAGATPAILGHNCIEGLNSLSGNGNIGLNPLFLDRVGPDGIAGTLDDNLRPSDFSPVRDAGQNALLPADKWDLDGDLNATEQLPIDLDGRDRRIRDPWAVTQGSGDPPLVDMGAYESPPSNCIPDFQPDGVLDIFDFIAFQDLFLAMDPRADLDQSTGPGVFDIFDFLVFQNLFTGGCP